MAYKEKANAIKYNNKFIADKYDRINLTIPKGRKVELQAAAERHGQSVNGLINSLIDAWMEQERAGGVPAVSPAVEDGEGVDLVSAGGSPTEDICSRSPSLTPPDFEPAPKQESLVDIVKRESMERNRQRLAELDAKVSKGGRLTRTENTERRRLTKMFETE